VTRSAVKDDDASRGRGIRQAPGGDFVSSIADGLQPEFPCTVEQGGFTLVAWLVEEAILGRRDVGDEARGRGERG
jgi:hypothetical protein